MSDFLKKLMKKEHAGILSSLMERAERRVIYAGDPSLDWSVKGWHAGGINLIAGPMGSGKSAVALRSAVDRWKENPDSYVILFDTEYYYYKDDRMYRRILEYGIDGDKVVYVPGNTLAEAFDGLPQLEADLKGGKLKVAAVVVDSLGGIQNTNAENKILEGAVEEAGDSNRGNAKIMNPILGFINRITAIHGFPAFIVQHCIKNQERYGDKWVLLGGERLKYLSQRVLILEGSVARDSRMTVGDLEATSTDEYHKIVGKKILAKCVKTRGGMEGAKAEFWFNFAECRFARPEESLFNLAANLGVIYHPASDNGKVNNAWWEYDLVGRKVKVHGQDQMKEMLATNAELFGRVLEDCRNSSKLSATGEDMTEVVTEAAKPL